MVNDMKNIKCQDNDLWNLHVEGLKNFWSRVDHSREFLIFFIFERSNFHLEKCAAR